MWPVRQAFPKPASTRGKIISERPAQRRSRKCRNRKTQSSCRPGWQKAPGEGCLRPRLGSSRYFPPRFPLRLLDLRILRFRNESCDVVVQLLQRSLVRIDHVARLVEFEFNVALELRGNWQVLHFIDAFVKRRGEIEIYRLEHHFQVR